MNYLSPIHPKRLGPFGIRGGCGTAASPMRRGGYTAGAAGAASTIAQLAMKYGPKLAMLLASVLVPLAIDKGISALTAPPEEVPPHAPRRHIPASDDYYEPEAYEDLRWGHRPMLTDPYYAATEPVPPPPFGKQEMLATGRGVLAPIY